MDMLFSEVVNSSIFICAGDSLWRPEKRQFLFNFFFAQILTNFYSFCRPKKRQYILQKRENDITEVQFVAMLGFHKLCCHVGVSQIMLPCWDFTNYVAMFWSSQIMFSVTKRKGKDVPV
jgi:hypothetical protein